MKNTLEIIFHGGRLQMLLAKSNLRMIKQNFPKINLFNGLPGKNMTLDGLKASLNLLQGVTAYIKQFHKSFANYR